MNKYIFIAVIAAVTTSALITLARADTPNGPSESNKVPAIEEPALAAEVELVPPTLQRFGPDSKIPSSACRHDKDSQESIEKSIDMCIASKQNWIRF